MYLHTKGKFDFENYRVFTPFCFHHVLRKHWNCVMDATKYEILKSKPKRSVKKNTKIINIQQAGFPDGHPL
jgi:hypothetical protein